MGYACRFAIRVDMFRHERWVGGVVANGGCRYLLVRPRRGDGVRACFLFCFKSVHRNVSEDITNRQGNYRYK